MKSAVKPRRAKRNVPKADSSATSRNPMLAEHLAASERVMKKVLSSKASSIAFLIDLGILNKSGKGLAKPYR